MNRFILSLAVAACLSVSYAAAEAPYQRLSVTEVRPRVQLISDVVYEQVPTWGYQVRSMGMDLLVPQTKEPKPAILVITGGGFINANKDNYIQERMRLAEEGYVVASMEYRTAPTAVYPEPVTDVKAAVRYLRAHAADFSIDPDRIGVLGGSAGGYLAAMAGLTNGLAEFDTGDNLDVSSDVAAVVDLYGVSDLTSIGADYASAVQALHRESGATEALWLKGSPVFTGQGGGVDVYAEEARAASPIHYVSPSAPPFLIMHGDKDVVVSPSQSAALHEALSAAGADSTRYVVEGAGHGGVPWVQDEVLQVIIDFFNAHLKNK